MKKKHAQDLVKLTDECPRCKNGKMKVIDGRINNKNYYLRCWECGYEYDD